MKGKEGFTSRYRCPRCEYYINGEVLKHFSLKDRAIWLYTNLRFNKRPSFNFYDSVDWTAIFEFMNPDDKKTFWESYREIKENFDKVGESEYKRIRAKIKEKKYKQSVL